MSNPDISLPDDRSDRSSIRADHGSVSSDQVPPALDHLPPPVERGATSKYGDHAEIIQWLAAVVHIQNVADDRLPEELTSEFWRSHPESPGGASVSAMMEALALLEARHARTDWRALRMEKPDPFTEEAWSNAFQDAKNAALIGSAHTGIAPVRDQAEVVRGLALDLLQGDELAPAIRDRCVGINERATELMTECNDDVVRERLFQRYGRVLWEEQNRADAGVLASSKRPAPGPSSSPEVVVPKPSGLRPLRLLQGSSAAVPEEAPSPVASLAEAVVPQSILRNPLRPEKRVVFRDPLDNRQALEDTADATPPTPAVSRTDVASSLPPGAAPPAVFGWKGAVDGPGASTRKPPRRPDRRQTSFLPKQLTRAHWHEVKEGLGRLSRPIGPTGIGDALARLEAAYADWDSKDWLPQRETEDEHKRAGEDLKKAKKVRKYAQAAAKKPVDSTRSD